MKLLKLKRKIFFYFSSILIGLSIINCNDDNNYNSLTRFLLENKQITIGDYSSSLDVEVISNVDWRVDSKEEWIQLQKFEGKLIINFLKNESDLSRNGKIYLYGKGNEVKDVLEIKQSKLLPSIQINEGSDFISLNSNEQEIELTVESNSSWKLTKDFEWISLNKIDGEKGKSIVKLIISENRLQARNGIISFDFGGEKPFNFIVSQSSANTGFEDTTHNFYVTFGTLPTLYAGLHLLTHEIPSFVFYERNNTYDPQYLPSYATPINLGGNDVQNAMRDYMKAKILKINAENPNAVFGLYVDDFRVRIGYDWFISQGIDSSRVKVTLLTDGTGSYNEFYKRYGSSGQAEGHWKNTINEINNLNWGNKGKKNLSNKAIPEFESWDWPWPISTKPNFRYFLQFPDLLETEDSYVKTQIPLMNTINIPPYELLNSLSQDKKNTFLKMVGLDHKAINTMLNKSPKKNLVIISTVNSASLETVIDKTMEKYSSEYDIFFSRHPADNQWQMYEQKYPNLTILPYMPFEVFFWYFQDQIAVIGGSPSSTFLTVPIEKVKFMYAVGPQVMPKPLNLVMNSSEANIDWMLK